MRYHIKYCYLILAIAIIILSPIRSQLNETNNITTDNCLRLGAIELANITVSSQVYELYPNSIASFDYNKIEPAKQEIYNVTVTNSGEVELDDVIVFISATKDIIFKNLAHYDISGNLQLECSQFDLCHSASTSLIKNLGSLKSNESRSIIINAYAKPQADNTQIDLRVIGTKLNGTVSDKRDRAERAECIFVDRAGKLCEEKMEGCICQRPTWTTEFVDPAAKPRITLSQILVTNKIDAIQTTNGKWYFSNSNNEADIEGYIPSEADQVSYIMTVSNTDSDNSLKQIRVVAELPDGMIYKSSSSILDQGSEQMQPKIDGNNITWEIPEIEPNSQSIIKYVAAFHGINKLRRFETKVHAEGIWDTEYALIADQSQIISLSIPEFQEKPKS